MTNEQYIEQIKELSQKLDNWRIVIGQQARSDFVMGIFFDETEKQYNVYINYERGLSKIRLKTYSENEAFKRLYNMVIGELEILSKVKQ